MLLMDFSRCQKAAGACQWVKSKSIVIQNEDEKNERRASPFNSRDRNIVIIPEFSSNGYTFTHAYFYI